MHSKRWCVCGIFKMGLYCFSNYWSYVFSFLPNSSGKDIFGVVHPVRMDAERQLVMSVIRLCECK
jgi:hypothetical protein